MGDKSKIQWTDATWNPTTGCTKVSAGCANCYAERVTRRLQTIGAQKYGDGFKLKLHPGELRIPLAWKKPRKIFVDSMSDLFHPDVPDAFLDRVFAVMSVAGQHSYQILTKRPERAAEYLSNPTARQAAWAYYAIKEFGYEDDGQLPMFPLPNVWLGASCENQAAYDARAPYVKHFANPFLSLEPLLGPVAMNVICCWTIVGGESGPKARPMHPGWARDIRDQCQAVNVPFFFKQWGEWGPIEDDTPSGVPLAIVARTGRTWQMAASPFEQGCPVDSCPWDAQMVRVGKHRAGRLLDGREWNEFPG